MRTGSVSILDVIQQRHRLTGGFHIAEDEQAVAKLRRFRGPSDRVGDLTRDRGVFSGPIFKGIFTNDPAGGEPYVSARELVNTHVSPTNFLARSHGQLLDVLRLQEGMILVTCSGMNLGRAIWVRSDLEGLIGSGDLIRIQPDAEKIPPGYLFAFLASRYGHALVRKQIYGGHIKHVDPAHIADLPVPRLGEKNERRAHRLIEEAAAARSQSAQLKRKAQQLVLGRLGLADISATGTPTSFAAFSIRSVDLTRLDAGFHSPSCRAAASALAGSTPRTHSLSELANVFTPGIFKRRYVDSPEYGYAYYSGTELFQLDAAPRGHLAKKWSGIEDYRVSTNWLLTGCCKTQN